ncbi:spore cortex biosynthesis protein YabQ [uncultured Clostridium sp.]|uniref:spore cortex biosynthesis protein YabQ n=1 Tax=uncultured Clostridium sp. TaxID=59620 RepID=UPI0026333DB4|nr:spore cortex biosynthesis protein YabQ [uncultured Clostridium sp.]
MIASIDIQLRIVIFSIVAGVLIGFLFDSYRVVRGSDSHKLITIIEDVLFWILCGMTIFLFLLYFNNAYLNMYIYMLIGVGLTFYLLVFSSKIFKLENLLAIFVYRIIRILSKNLRYIFKNIFTK